MLSKIFLLAAFTATACIPSATAGIPGLPETLGIYFDLYHKHTDVDHPTVVFHFINNIFNLALADLQAKFPDKVITTVNFKNGPSTNKDIDIALTSVWINKADEKSGHKPASEGGGRYQKDWVAGYASFSVREAAADHPSSVKTYPVVENAFLAIWSRIAGGTATDLLCVRCDAVPKSMMCRPNGAGPCTPLGAPIDI